MLKELGTIIYFKINSFFQGSLCFDSLIEYLGFRIKNLDLRIKFST